MNPQLKSIVDALEKLFPGSGTKEGVDATLEMEQRAQAAGFETKALDAEAGTKALSAVKELETKLAEVTTLASTQADTILALDTRLKAMETAQAAYQSRGEKAINEVKGLLVTLNTKPELTAPAEQAKLEAAEAATKAKLEAAEGAGKSGDALTLKRFEYGQDGRPVVKPI